MKYSSIFCRSRESQLALQPGGVFGDEVQNALLEKLSASKAFALLRFRPHSRTAARKTSRGLISLATGVVSFFQEMFEE